ncbi:MAG: ion transporter [Halobacteriales archaeon]|nr:ion transporter [Halobacteriales archaeon]
MVLNTYRTYRKKTYRLFAPEKGGRIGRYVDWIIMILIILNVIAVMLETVDVVKARFGTLLIQFEVFSVVIFTVEYMGRLWSAVEHPDYTGRPRFMFKPIMVVDLLAILPFYLLLFGVGADLRFLRSVRLFRIFRLFKIARYSRSMQSFRSVLADKKPDLVVALFINVILLVITSSIVYHFEHPVQPEAFSSIPETFWWGIATLTTVGYGDITPVTPMGKLFGGITAVLGIGLFALPASILAAGFIEEAGSEDKTCPNCGEKIKENYKEY